ncbi:MAG: RHS repeat-associated core domain-containing protein [Acidobacteria bacterium]|nr:RHS repeat-associated core domain-containing protein [Acidobacteriota bacterium]
MESRPEQKDEACGSNVYSLTALHRLHWISPDGNDQEFVDKKSLGTPQPPGQVCVNGSVFGSPNYYNREKEFISTDGSGMTFLSDVDITDAGGQFINGYLMKKDGTRYRIDGSRVSWMTDRHGNKIEFVYGSDGLGRPIGIKDPLGRTITLEYHGFSPSHNDEDWIRLPGAVFRTVKVRYTDLSAALRDGGSVKMVKELFRNASYLDYPTVNSQYHNPKVIQEIELPNGQKYIFRYNQYGELAKATLPTGGYVEYDWGAGSQADADGLYGQLMVYRRLTERRRYVGGILEGKTLYSIGIQSGSLAVTATEQNSGGGILRKFVSYYSGDPTTAADIAENGFSRWRDGKQLAEEVQTSAGSVVQNTSYVWAQRDPTNNESITPAADASPSDPRVTMITKTTTGKDALRTTIAYSVDAFNNITEQCDYATSPSPAPAYRCQMFEYVTESTYTTASVHLRALVKKESIGPQDTKTVNNVTTYPFHRESETMYEYDKYCETPACTGASGTNTKLTSYSDISMHDTGRGQNYTERGNRTKVSRWYDVGGRYIDEMYEYDIAGNVTKITKPEMNADTVVARPVTSASYADNYSTYGPPAVTIHTYAFPTSVQEPGGFTIGAKYHYGLGVMIERTDPNGKLTKYQYGGYNLENGTLDSTKSDPLDRLTSVNAPIGTTNFFYFSATNTVRTERSREGSAKLISDSTVDGFGRPQKVTQGEDGGTITTETQYDALGRAYRISAPYRTAATNWTATTFDELDRPLDTTFADNSVSRTRYLAGGYSVTRDAAGKWMKRWVDAIGRVYSVVEDPQETIDSFNNPTGQAVQTGYGYNARGMLILVGQVSAGRSFGYDSLGRLVSASLPETGTSVSDDGVSSSDTNGLTSYYYDDLGNLTYKADPRTQVAYTYDIRSRILRKNYFGFSTPEATYCYDGSTTSTGCSTAPTESTAGTKNLKGRLTMVTNGNARSMFPAYDAIGRPLGSTQEISGLSGIYSFGYSYNDLGLTGVVYPSGRTVSYGFDGAGRVNSLTGLTEAGTTGYVSAISYAENGGVSKMAMLSGRYETRCYNNRQQVEYMVLRSADTSLTTCTDATGNPLTLQLGYGTDNNGNVRSQTISSGSWSVQQTYTYDGFNRLKTAEEATITGGAGWKQTFGYDNVGNRWINTLESNGISYGANVPNGSSWYSGKNRLKLGLGAHDLAGNQVRLDPFTGSYDAENRLTGLSSASNGQVLFVYDAEGRRVKKTVILSSGVRTTYYLYTADGELAVEMKPASQDTTAECTTCFLFGDHLGSTRAVWDGSTGGVVSRMDYLPFGEMLGGDRNLRSGQMCGTGTCFDGGGESLLKFTGKERDIESGLDYFGARYFSGAQGRFTTPDPLMASAKASDPQTWNRYAYALNNPLKFVDPDGLEVPDSCVKDPSCTIVIKLNVVYDATMNRGRGPNQQQRQKWEKEQLAKAKKDYGHSNITLEATYTPGRYDVGSDGQTPILKGLNPDALNVMVSQGTPNNKAGVSYLDQNGPVSIININDAIGGNWWPAVMNTTAHELGHHFLGHVGTRPSGALDVIGKEYDVDNRLLMQSVGRPQQDFREGVKQKRYAVPLHPEANKPRQ